jgi:hypothetical protein
MIWWIGIVLMLAAPLLEKDQPTVGGVMAVLGMTLMAVVVGYLSGTAPRNRG